MLSLLESDPQILGVFVYSWPYIAFTVRSYGAMRYVDDISIYRSPRWGFLLVSATWQLSDLASSNKKGDSEESPFSYRLKELCLHAFLLANQVQCAAGFEPFDLHRAVGMIANNGVAAAIFVLHGHLYL